jgi:hypothetical protein
MAGVELLTAALAYGARGWPVLACQPRGKRPLLEHGLHDATTDAGQIRSWWTRWPHANIGLRTGVAFDVLDVDGPAGEAALAAAMPGPDAPSVDGPTVVTGHGWHVYVTPTGLGNRAGVVGHVDWRGAGGYVIAPPSTHPSGAVYRWELDDDPDFGPAAPIRPAPAWLRDLLEPPRAAVSPPSPSSRGDSYGRRALESEAGRLALAPVGQRNAELHRAAVRLGQLVHAGQVDAGDVIDALLSVGVRIGLAEREVEATIGSGMRFGMENGR